MTSVHIPAGSSQMWTDCLTLRNGGPCPTVPTASSAITALGIGFGGGAANLMVFGYPSLFIARVCGNNTTPVVAHSDPVPLIAGFKFDDSNRDGVQNPGEPGLGGFTFQLVRLSSLFGDQPVGPVTSTASDGNGNFSFPMNGFGPGTYSVQEVAQAGWVPTGATSQTVVVPDGKDSAVVAHVVFGNRAEHPPVANAGPAQVVDQTAPSGATVRLDGTASSDPDGDALSYIWTGPFGSTTGPTPTVTMPVGTSTVLLTVSDGILTSQASTTVTVFPPITLIGGAISPIEGIVFSGPVATFTDPDPNAMAAEYGATIDWGDGTTTPATISKNPDGSFAVGGTHTYADEADLNATVTVADLDNAFNTRSAVTTVTVGDAPLAATPASGLTAVVGDPGPRTVATFTDANPAGPVSDFQATINWGDGTPAPGTVVGSGGNFRVDGTHPYAHPGGYAIAVHIADIGGSLADTSSTIQITKAPTTTTVTSAVNPSVFGQPVTLTATVAVTAPGAGSPTGEIDFFDGTTPLGSGTLTGNSFDVTISTFAVGTHPITAVYSGDSDFIGSTSPEFDQKVNKAATTTALVASPPGPSNFGQPVTFTATVAPVAPGAGSPTGPVDFSVDGVAVGNQPLNATETASIATSSLSPGTHTARASYEGDGSFFGSTTSIDYRVTCADVTITGFHRGAVIVTGTVCIIDAHVTGAVVVQKGGSVAVENSTIDGALTATDQPNPIQVCNSHIGGALDVIKAQALVMIGDPGDANCTPNTILGVLLLQHNNHGVEAIGNLVGNLTLADNSGPGPFPGDVTTITDNTIITH